MRTRFNDWISIIEAGYDLNGNDQQWLTQLRNKAEPLIDRGLWPSMMTYRYSPTNVEIEHCAINGPGNLVQWAKQSTKQPQDALDFMFRNSIAVGSLSDKVYKHVPGLKHAVQKVTSGIMSDILAVKAITGNGRGILLWTGFMDSTCHTRKELTRWPLVASHMGAGLLLRRLAQKVSFDDLDHSGNPIEAILEPSGKVQHLTGRTTNSTCNQLRNAALIVESVRNGKSRDDPEKTLPLWKGLINGHWSIDLIPMADVSSWPLEMTRITSIPEVSP